MKKIFASLLAILTLAINVFAQDSSTRTFDFGDFNGIDAGFVHHIYVTEGKSDKIEVTYPVRYENNLDYKVMNGILHLDMDLPAHQQKGRKGVEEIIVKIQMKEISSISLSGAAEMTFEGNFKGSSTAISLSGVSKINGVLNLEADDLDCDISGTAKCTINGTFKEVENRISGAAKTTLNAETEKLSIASSGAANGVFEGKAENISITCSGAAKFTLKGSTENIDIKCSGASKVEAEKMVAKNAKAAASGASKILVYGDDRLELHATAGSSIVYYGEAKDVRMTNDAITRGN